VSTLISAHSSGFLNVYFIKLLLNLFFLKKKDIKVDEMPEKEFKRMISESTNRYKRLQINISIILRRQHRI
jgi:hypothetical protein